jgi:N-acetylneuraminate synthase/N,N'-diacetyllegionaminate synthase
MTSPAGSILFLVPARGGSVRVPGKNLRLVGGIPLVGRAVRVARAAAAALPGGPHPVLCTTDDPAIAAAAAAWGAGILERPGALATPDATSVDVALHALDATTGGSYESLVLLQPTSPLVEPSDVIAAVERHRAAAGASVASVTTGHPSTWHQGMDATGRLVPAAAVSGSDVRLAGAIFVVTPAELRATHRFVSPGATFGHPIPAARAIDVDEEEDLLAAEAILAARPVRPVPLAGRAIGAGSVFVIAEAGVNHNGDLDIAFRLVDAAAEAGADAVKFQTFDPAALAAAGAPTAEYQRRAGAGDADQRELLTRLALPTEAWAELKAHAEARRLVFLSTPFDDGSASLLDGLGVPAFKVGSGELTNLSFIGRLARRGRPLLISTGMADMIEVAAAVDTVAANGDVPLALFHCVSSYPAAPEDANMRAIETLRRAFGVPVGWSDHTPGIEMPLAAVAAGATLIEKHLTLDRALPGPDHQASLEPDALAAMVRAIRAVEASLGTGVKAPVPAEADVARVARRSLHWSRSLPSGRVIAAEDVAILRPGTGLAPARVADVVDRRTSRPVREGMAVEPGDVEGLG